MDIINIDTTNLITLGDNLIAISTDFDSYVENFEDYVTKLQQNGIWRGSSATKFRDLSKLDIKQYKDYSKSIEEAGKKIKEEAEALEEEIASLKEI